MDRNKVTRQMVQEWFEAAERGEAQAAYRLAEFGLKQAAEGDRAAAEGWLRRAATLGGVPMMWQIAHLTAERTELGAHWQRAAIAAEWGDSDVTVDENTFELYQVNGSCALQDFSVRVQGEPDEAVRTALEAAANRFMCVGDDGVEYEDGEIALDDADYTPNYVSDPEAAPTGGWQLWLDCKGGVMPLMAGTQLRILVEELRRAGVTSVRIGPRMRDKPARERP
ncbi:hypothetical protein [Micromonospora endolithica]|uniref:Sel1 repeat family protein n=1 Tax=Micromonospora endolithica TaxID=230091 RepID=A0A3A9YZA6_9ACTN|nr:hypothetical protein [Micromonospora endolithica]RKN40557.1 hypothetical protein D7223_25775 [Micromonospora endolithica]TWJ21631.1 hypothetical protein JD76_01741 [Micromonospora endolithica]